MNTETKLFAFRLADKQAAHAARNDGKWKAREGIVAQACTGATATGLHLADSIHHDSSVPC